MNAVFFVGIGICIFLAALVAVKKDKKVFDTILLIWLIVNTGHLLYFYVNIELRNIGIPKHLLFPGAILAYLSAPMLFLYVKALVSEKQFYLTREWYHFLPFFIMLISFYYVDLFDNGTEIWVESAVFTYRGELPFYMRQYALIMAFFCFTYPMACVILLQNHRQRIKNEFSYSEKITLNWLRHWLVLEIIGFWVTFIIIWVAEFEYIELLTSFKVIGTIVAFNVFVIGFFGIRQQGIFIETDTNSQSTQSKYAKSNLDTIWVEELVNKLERIMMNEKLYLNMKLNIDQLSQKMEVSKHVLSQVINEHLEMNFYDLVNSYRLKEFKDRLTSEEFSHLSILGIALECGFNSKSSFNYIFKKNEGMTPTEYRRKHTS